MRPPEDLSALRALAQETGATPWVEERTRRINPLLRATYGTDARHMAEALAHAAYLKAANRAHANKSPDSDHQRYADGLSEMMAGVFARLSGRRLRRVQKLLDDVPPIDTQDNPSDR